MASATSGFTILHDKAQGSPGHGSPALCPSGLVPCSGLASACRSSEAHIHSQPCPAVFSPSPGWESVHSSENPRNGLCTMRSCWNQLPLRTAEAAKLGDAMKARGKCKAIDQLQVWRRTQLPQSLSLISERKQPANQVKIILHERGVSSWHSALRTQSLLKRGLT